MESFYKKLCYANSKPTSYSKIDNQFSIPLQANLSYYDEISSSLDMMMAHIKTGMENRESLSITQKLINGLFRVSIPMVLYFMRSLVFYDKPPKNLTDSNIISDYTKITSMFDLYKNEEDKKEIIHDIINERRLSTTIVDKFNLKIEFTRDQFLSLMYYLGLLTVNSGYGAISMLKTPNYIIKTIYFEYYFYYLSKIIDVGIDVSKVNEAVYKLSAENDPLLFKSIIETMLKRLDNRDFIKYGNIYLSLSMMNAG